jgi:hypothetical protein
MLLSPEHRCAGPGLYLLAHARMRVHAPVCRRVVRRLSGGAVLCSPAGRRVVRRLSGGAVLCSPAGANGHQSFERASVRARLENQAVWKKQAEAGALLLPRVGGGPRFGRRRRRSGFSRWSAALTRPAACAAPPTSFTCMPRPPLN